MKEYIKKDIDTIEAQRQKQISFIKGVNPGTKRKSIENELPDPELGRLRNRLEGIEGMERMDEIATNLEIELSNPSPERLEEIEEVFLEIESGAQSARESRQRLINILKADEVVTEESNKNSLRVPTFLKDREIEDYHGLEYVPTISENKIKREIRMEYPQNRPKRKTVKIERVIQERRKEARKKELESRSKKI